MALHVSSCAFFTPTTAAFVPNKFGFQRIRAAAASAETEEEGKVKLGDSDLKVTRLGCGAWSWGDTSYWNNMEWDGYRSHISSRASFDASLGWWCDIPGTIEEVRAKLQLKQGGAIKRERAFAYSQCQKAKRKIETSALQAN